MMKSDITAVSDQMTRIEELKKEKNAAIMAHYYTLPQVQEVADYVGDSYFLSEKAAEIEADMIVLCGVSFMGESAKTLSPDKKVILPASDADCPMAHMATPQDVAAVREKYDDLAVVCYVNSTAELKAVSNVCVTSSNALKIVRGLSEKNIYFVPDQNLAHFIADELPEKNFIFHSGYCYVHHQLSLEDILAKKAEYPQAQVLVHPECRPEVTALADYAGSTSGIIKYASESDCKTFLIATEMGIFHELVQRCPDKEFHPVSDRQVCEGMKKITLEKIIEALETEAPQVQMETSLTEAAHRPLKRMLELSK